MRIRLNYSPMQRWCTDYHKLVRGWPHWLLNFLRDEAQDFLNKVRMRTPVDTGRLRNSWKLVRISWVGSSVQALFINDANDGYADYASFVELGHATPYHAGAGPGSGNWVQGRFMLQYTEKEMQALIPVHLKSQVSALFRKYNVG